MDWNNDGKKDLIVGDKTYGYVHIFLNSGSDAGPVFTTSTQVKIGLTTFAAQGGDSAPCVVDWNNDGKKDLLVGENTGGEINLLINNGSDAAPLFTSVTLIQDGGANLSLASEDGRSVPWAVDWNADGKKDLLVGSTGVLDGTNHVAVVRFYENKGTDAAPVFNGYINLSAGGSTILANSHSRPVTTDWDNDGVLDLIVGAENGSLKFFKRTALDNDSDLMPDWWENRYLPEGTNATASGDGDADGSDNLSEYLAGTNPTNEDSVLAFVVSNCAATSEENLEIKWYSVSNKYYSLNLCTNLLQSPWVTVASNIPATAPINVVTVRPSNTNAIFYRVKVEE
ncbi:FG-GAP repeat domain-containing protein [Verrucomicrobiota bacterium]